MLRWTPGKVALVALCMLVGAACAARGDELEHAGIITKKEAGIGAIAMIVLALIYFWIMYEVNKSKRGK